MAKSKHGLLYCIASFTLRLIIGCVLMFIICWACFIWGQVTQKNQLELYYRDLSLACDVVQAPGKAKIKNNVVYFMDHGALYFVPKKEDMYYTERWIPVK